MILLDPDTRARFHRSRPVAHAVFAAACALFAAFSPAEAGAEPTGDEAAQQELYDRWEAARRDWEAANNRAEEAYARRNVADGELAEAQRAVDAAQQNLRAANEVTERFSEGKNRNAYDDALRQREAARDALEQAQKGLEEAQSAATEARDVYERAETEAERTREIEKALRRELDGEDAAPAGDTGADDDANSSGTDDTDRGGEPYPSDLTRAAFDDLAAALATERCEAELIARARESATAAMQALAGIGDRAFAGAAGAGDLAQSQAALADMNRLAALMKVLEAACGETECFDPRSLQAPSDPPALTAGAPAPGPGEPPQPQPPAPPPSGGGAAGGGGGGGGAGGGGPPLPGSSGAGSGGGGEPGGGTAPPTGQCVPQQPATAATTSGGETLESLAARGSNLARYDQGELAETGAAQLVQTWTPEFWQALAAGDEFMTAAYLTQLRQVYGGLHGPANLPAHLLDAELAETAAELSGILLEIRFLRQIQPAIMDSFGVGTGLAHSATALLRGYFRPHETNSVLFGDTVALEPVGGGEPRVVTLTAPERSNGENRLSSSDALGRELLGRQQGAEVVIDGQAYRIDIRDAQLSRGEHGEIADARLATLESQLETLLAPPSSGTLDPRSVSGLVNRAQRVAGLAGRLAAAEEERSRRLETLDFELDQLARADGVRPQDRRAALARAQDLRMEIDGKVASARRALDSAFDGFGVLRVEVDGQPLWQALWQLEPGSQAAAALVQRALDQLAERTRAQIERWNVEYSPQQKAEVLGSPAFAGVREQIGAVFQPLAPSCNVTRGLLVVERVADALALDRDLERNRTFQGELASVTPLLLLSGPGGRVVRTAAEIPGGVLAVLDYLDRAERAAGFQREAEIGVIRQTDLGTANQGPSGGALALELGLRALGLGGELSGLRIAKGAELIDDGASGGASVLRGLDDLAPAPRDVTGVPPGVPQRVSPQACQPSTPPTQRAGVAAGSAADDASRPATLEFATADGAEVAVDLTGELGRGGFGACFRGTVTGGKPDDWPDAVAVKRYFDPEGLDDDIKGHLLASRSNRNPPRMLAIVEDQDGNLYMVQDLIGGDPLSGPYALGRIPDDFRPPRDISYIPRTDRPPTPAEEAADVAGLEDVAKAGNLAWDWKTGNVGHKVFADGSRSTFPVDRGYFDEALKSPLLEVPDEVDQVRYQIYMLAWDPTFVFPGGQQIFHGKVKSLLDLPEDVRMALTTDHAAQTIISQEGLGRIAFDQSTGRFVSDVFDISHYRAQETLGAAIDRIEELHRQHRTAEAFRARIGAPAPAADEVADAAAGGAVRAAPPVAPASQPPASALQASPSGPSPADEIAAALDPARPAITAAEKVLDENPQLVAALGRIPQYVLRLSGLPGGPFSYLTSQAPFCWASLGPPIPDGEGGYFVPIQTQDPHLFGPVYGGTDDVPLDLGGDGNLGEAPYDGGLPDDTDELTDGERADPIDGEAEDGPRDRDQMGDDEPAGDEPTSDQIADQQPTDDGGADDEPTAEEVEDQGQDELADEEIAAEPGDETSTADANPPRDETAPSGGDDLRDRLDREVDDLLDDLRESVDESGDPQQVVDDALDFIEALEPVVEDAYEQALEAKESCEVERYRSALARIEAARSAVADLRTAFGFAAETIPGGVQALTDAATAFLDEAERKIADAESRLRGCGKPQDPVTTTPQNSGKDKEQIEFANEETGDPIDAGEVSFVAVTPPDGGTAGATDVDDQELTDEVVPGGTYVVMASCKQEQVLSGEELIGTEVVALSPKPVRIRLFYCERLDDEAKARASELLAYLGKDPDLGRYRVESPEFTSEQNPGYADVPICTLTLVPLYADREHPLCRDPLDRTTPPDRIAEVPPAGAPTPSDDQPPPGDRTSPDDQPPLGERTPPGDRTPTDDQPPLGERTPPGEQRVPPGDGGTTPTGDRGTPPPGEGGGTPAGGGPTGGTPAGGGPAGGGPTGGGPTGGGPTGGGPTGGGPTGGGPTGGGRTGGGPTGSGPTGSGEGGSQVGDPPPPGDDDPSVDEVRPQPPPKDAGETAAPVKPHTTQRRERGRKEQGTGRAASSRRGAGVPATYPSDPLFHSSGSWGQSHADQWGLHRIGFAPAAGRGTSTWPADGRRIVVAVVDTGVDRYHPELRGAVWRNPGEIAGNGLDDDGNGYVDDVYGWNFADGNSDTRDLNGHGTVVAGIIAAWSNNGIGIAGVNPWARIMPVKITTWSGRSSSFELADAIRYAVDNGARVINVSYGGGIRNWSEYMAVTYARQRGALVVAATGNEARSTRDDSPGGLPGVITVAATDVGDERLGFSNWGPGVDIAAPGWDILSVRARGTDLLKFTRDDYQAGGVIVGEDRRYYRLTGTSFAAPFVSGVASLILAVRPELTDMQVARMILHSAKDIETPGWDQYTGYGRLDARAALAADPEFYVLARIRGVAAKPVGREMFLEVSGRARANRFRRAWIEIGAGHDPQQWTKVTEDITAAVDEGPLALVPASRFAASAEWTLRLVVEHRDGARREARYHLKVR